MMRRLMVAAVLLVSAGRASVSGGEVEWNTMSPGSMGEPPYARCFTHGAPAIEDVTFGAVEGAAGPRVTACVRRPELSRTMPVSEVALLHLDRASGRWAVLRLGRVAGSPDTWRGELPYEHRPHAYALVARDASGHLAVKLPALRGGGADLPLLDDPDESPAVLQDDLDIRRIWIGTDGEWLYLRMAMQGKPGWGSSNPLFLHIFCMGTLGPGMGKEAVRQLLAFGPALRMAGMPAVVVTTPASFGKGLKASDKADGRLTDEDVRLKVRLDALERDADGSVLASFVTAGFQGASLTLCDGTAPVRLYLPRPGEAALEAPAPSLKELVVGVEAPVRASTQPATKVGERVVIADAASLRDDDPNFPYRTGTMVRRIQSRRPVEPLMFAVISDTHSHARVYPYLLRRVAELRPAFMLNIGDMVQVGLSDHYERYAKLSAGCVLPWVSVLGNHDSIKNRSWRQYVRHFGPTDYWFDYGPARFIALNTVTFNFFESQLDELDRLLDTPKRKFVLMHRPPRYLAPHWPSPVTGGEARFKEIVERRRVDRVILGHIHLFSRKVIGGVTYVVNAGGGGTADIRGEGGVFHVGVYSVSQEGVHDMVVLPNFPPGDVVEGDGRTGGEP
ncbi:MAG: metallophosphoesterase [Phycisphaerae bacterium]|nr:metallophosphoesterase [Phycisphaerae bacterium]